MNEQLHHALATFLREEVDDTTIIALHNEHAPGDDYVYTCIEDIAELVATDSDPTRLARMVYFGNVQSWDDNYFCLNGYANIDSFDSLTDDLSPVDFGMLADVIIENEQFDEVNFDAAPYLSDDE